MQGLFKDRRLLAAALAAVAFAAFLPALRNGFVDYDDNSYITNNGIVQAGLTWFGARWALTTTFFANWHPLTWLSHMLDCQLFGTAAWGHHLVSLLLHAAVAAVVFLFLDEATSDRPRSAAVALFFALHPLRVESVVWASERKDLLCALFFILACRSHIRRVRRAGTGTWVTVFGALALMSKPMAVTLPLALLVLDFWPLRRREGPRRLVVEKVPLFVLSAAAAVMTMLAQVEGGAVARLPLSARLGHTCVNLVGYLKLTFWPRRLIPLYLGTPPSPWLLWGSIAAVLALTASAALLWRSRPAVTAGWAWFVVTLLPVLGIVQAGSQSIADRYTYLPHLGLFVAVAWLAPDVAPRLRPAALAAVCAVAALLGGLSWRQTRYWKDSEVFFGRLLEVSPRNPIGSFGLGLVRLRQHRLAEAESLLRESLGEAAAPGTYVVLGRTLIEAGRPEEAMGMYQRAFRLAPADLEVRFWYASALIYAHRMEEAIAQYRAVQTIDSDYPGLALALGVALDVAGHGAEALPLLHRAAQLAPLEPAPHASLGTALARRGQFAEAAQEFETTLRLKPDYPGVEQALKFAREDAARAQH